MKNILGMDVDAFDIKEGDIKVDSEELRTMLRVVQTYHSILGNLLGELSGAEEEQFNTGIKYTEYFQNKYIYLSEVRKEQKKWWDVLQRLNDEDFIKGYSEEEVSGVRSDIWNFYLAAKSRREELQREVDMVKLKEKF